MYFIKNNQWPSMGFWCPGQEAKLAPLFLIYFQKISQMVDPKQILVAFKSEKQKNKNKKKKQQKTKGT